MKNYAYYNENDPFCVEWLKTLIMMGEISDGEVDSRSIKDVQPSDLHGFTRCHFFAGIAGWDYALKLAGWPEEREVWTGSCPCQPFSVAGKQKGNTDERHLWPIWFKLIAECKPGTIFGEQVSGAIAHGWLDDVYQGLEAEGYAVGAAVLPACGVGAPHKRDRLWFVAHAESDRREQRRAEPIPAREARRLIEPSEIVADTDNAGLQRWIGKKLPERAGERTARPSSASMADPASAGSFSAAQTGIHSGEEGPRSRDEQFERCSSDASYPNSESQKRITKPRSERGFWDVEPFLGRTFNGFSLWLDRLDMSVAHKLVIAYGETTNTSPAKILFALRNGIDTSEIWESFGRPEYVSPAQVLFAYVCQLEEKYFNQTRLQPPSAEVSKEILRELRLGEESSRSPLRSKHTKQRGSKRPNTLYALSQFLARYAEKAWVDYCRENAVSRGWEEGVSRTASFTNNRAQRLRALGNAIVPEVAQAFIEAFLEAESDL